MATTESKPAAATNGSTTGIAVENPATGEIITTVPSLTAEEVHELAVKGRAAQPAWEAMGYDERGKIFRRAQKWVLDNQDRITDVIVSETGKTYEDTQLAEISYAAAAFGFWAKHAEEFLADEKVKSESLFVKGKKLVVRYKPLGLVGVIGPWNFPLTNSFGDCIPALAAGNSVILKPSEVTPLTSFLMAEMLRECGMPEDVFQVATGAGETGSALVDEVDFVMFTGSTKTGKLVAKRAADTLTPVGLELGGKDPMIVCADADVERAANAATYYSMNNGGQVCISVERVYVEEPVYDEFVAKVTDKVRELRQGESKGPGSIEVGAVIFPPQLDIVDSHVKDAVAKGAKVLTGGKQGAGPGRFYRADRSRGRRPHDDLHDRRDLRADAADHEGRRLRGGHPPRQRLGLRPGGIGLEQGRREGRGDRPPRRGRRGVRQRRADQLRRARVADGRLEDLRPRLAPRRLRHPQVLRPADASGDQAGHEEGHAHVPVQGAEHEAARPRAALPLRTRQARLAPR